MLGSLWAIIKNSFFEVIRQPIYGILLAAGVVLIAFSPVITMFTMMEDVKLTIDMGLGTIFMVGIALAVLSATQVVSREIDAKTAGAVISKPVGRFVFVVGKFLGMSMAVAMASYLFTIILLMTVRMGVPSTASYTLDWPVFLAEVMPAVLAIGYGIYANYFYRSNFTSTAALAAVPLYSVCMLALLFIGKGWDFTWIPSVFVENHVDQVLLGCVLVFLGVWLISSVAVAVSTRLGVVANVLVCLLIFFVGMVSHYLFGWTVDDSWVQWAPAEKDEAVVISGQIRATDGSGVAGVTLRGAPGLPVTDADGYYRVEVQRGEAGEITPYRIGWEFSPVSRTYAELREPRRGEDYRLVKRSYGASLWVKKGWHGLAWVAYHVVPSLQLFWAGDQLMRPDPYIPLAYVARSALYACSWSAAMVAFGAFLFERREII